MLPFFFRPFGVADDYDAGSKATAAAAPASPKKDASPGVASPAEDPYDDEFDFPEGRTEPSEPLGRSLPGQTHKPNRLSSIQINLISNLQRYKYA